MSKVIYEKDGRIGRVTLNRPDVLNAIDDELPRALADCVERANADPGVHVIVLSGAGRAFCAGYDLTAYAQTPAPTTSAGHAVGPDEGLCLHDEDTELFMSLWRSYRPVICKVHGFAVAGGSDIALCADTIVMADDAEIGYMPTACGVPDDGDVGLSDRAGAGETDAVHRRQDQGSRSGEARTGAEIGRPGEA